MNWFYPPLVKVNQVSPHFLLNIKSLHKGSIWVSAGDWTSEKSAILGDETWVDMSAGLLRMGYISIIMQIWYTCFFHTWSSSSWTRKVNEPNCSSRTPDIHLDFPWKFTLTVSPTWSILPQCFVFTIILALPTLVVAQSDKLEYSRSIWDLSCQPINNIAKDCSVTDCGVRRY